MNANKKVLTVLVVLLLIANVATLALFWLKKDDRSAPIEGGPVKFIIQELGFDEKQQAQYLALVEEHQQGVRPLRAEIRAAKDNFFSLLQKPKTTEPEKSAAAGVVSSYTEKLDLLTLNHFAKVRLICTPEQQKKFDGIIKQVIQMMGGHGNGRGPRPGPPPLEGDFPPPPPN